MALRPGAMVDKLQKRRQKRVKKAKARAVTVAAADAPTGGPVPVGSHTCSQCGAGFESRNQLFTHLRGDACGGGGTARPVVAGAAAPGAVTRVAAESMTVNAS